jgi:hypothetical protein
MRQSGTFRQLETADNGGTNRSDPLTPSARVPIRRSRREARLAKRTSGCPQLMTVC